MEMRVWCAAIWRRFRFRGRKKAISAAEAVQEHMPQDLLARILISAESLDSIIVGGQALNIWGEHYFEKARNELQEFTPFQSKDIDFFGDVGEAKALAQMLEGDLKIPSKDEFVTPSSAMIDIKVGDRHYVVDFLRAVAGLDTKIMTARASTLAVDLQDSDGIYRKTEVLLLNPLDVLLSRIAGVTILKRRDKGALRQLAAAPIIVREYIRELLDVAPEDPVALDEAQDAVREFIAIGGDAFNDVILREHGVDILAEAIKLSVHAAWDPRFAEHQIRKNHADVVEARARRIEESRRRQAGRASGDREGR